MVSFTALISNATFYSFKMSALDTCINFILGKYKRPIITLFCATCNICWAVMQFYSVKEGLYIIKRKLCRYISTALSLYFYSFVVIFLQLKKLSFFKPAQT